MKSVSWRILSAAGLGLLVIGLTWVSSRVGFGDQEAVPESDKPRSDLNDELQRAAKLDRERKVVGWAIATRSAIVSDLVAGRLNLFEAAAGFSEVDKVKERHHVNPDPLPQYFPAKTREEQLCRQVITGVEWRLWNQPEQGVVVARLEKELQEHLERYGTVQLPEFRRPEKMPWLEP
jgi:hypothetical protein